MPKTYVVRTKADADHIDERLRARGLDFERETLVGGGYRFNVQRAPSVDVEEIMANAITDDLR